jgi:DNA-binding NarL/FixJ family response regulator
MPGPFCAVDRAGNRAQARGDQKHQEAYRSHATSLTGPHDRLKPKELAIITFITQGKRNKEIAYELGTTEQVIKNYLCNGSVVDPGLPGSDLAHTLDQHIG